MAYNHDAPSDGAPAPPTPSGCAAPNPLVPCCNCNCDFAACAPASIPKLCPKCYTEQLLKEGAAAPDVVGRPLIDSSADPATEPASPQQMATEIGDLIPCTASPQDNYDTYAFDKEAGRVVEVDMPDPGVILKSKGSSPKQSPIPINTKAQAPAQHDPRKGKASSLRVDPDTQRPYAHVQQQRIPSPLTPSPLQLPQHEGGEGMSISMLPPPPRQQAVNRCMACRKRVGLRGFKCRCGDLFCAVHRYSDKHDCSFDYKAAGRLAIARENPVVKASKIDKI